MPDLSLQKAAAIDASLLPFIEDEPETDSAFDTNSAQIATAQKSNTEKEEAVFVQQILERNDRRFGYVIETQDTGKMGDVISSEYSVEKDYLPLFSFDDGMNVHEAVLFSQQRNQENGQAHVFTDTEKYYHEFQTEIVEHIDEGNLSQCYVIPEIWYISKKKPYAHQLEAFLRFRDAPYFALMMEMGTGKTKTAIDMAVYMFLKEKISAVLVIAPNMVHIQWEKQQFPEHCALPYKPLVWRGQQSFSSPRAKRVLRNFFESDEDVLKVFYVNVEAFQGDSIIPYIQQYVKEEETFIVLDESSKIKDGTSRRAQVINKLNDNGIRTILTGTPATKSPTNLHPQYTFLGGYSFWGEGVSQTVFEAQHTFRVRRQKRNRRMSMEEQYEIKETVQKFKVVFETYMSKKLACEARGDASGSNRFAEKAEKVKDPYSATAQLLGVKERDVHLIANANEFTQSKDINDILEKIDPITFRVLKKDCLDLPKKIYQTIEVEMSTRQQKLYQQMVQNMMIEYEDGESETGEPLTATSMFAWMTRLQQICAGILPVKLSEEDAAMAGRAFEAKPIDGNYRDNAKIAALLDHMEDNLRSFDSDDSDSDNGSLINEHALSEHGQQAIVWCNFDMEMRMIRNGLQKEGYTYVLLWGGMTIEEKQEAIKMFESGKAQVLVAKTNVGSHGLNLQFCSLAYYYTNSFRVEPRIQSEDRIHRSGQTEACLYIDIVAANSFDQFVSSKIREGKDLNDIVTTDNFMDVV